MIPAQTQQVTHAMEIGNLFAKLYALVIQLLDSSAGLENTFYKVFSFINFFFLSFENELIECETLRI